MAFVDITPWPYLVYRHGPLCLVYLIEDTPAPYLISVMSRKTFEFLNIRVPLGVCLQMNKTSIKSGLELARDLVIDFLSRFGELDFIWHFS